MRAAAPSLLISVVSLAGCGLIKDPVDQVTNAAFTAPSSVKRNQMVELVAMYRRGSNGQLLGYRWTMDEQPSGSHAALEDVDAQSARFLPDRLGPYLITLVVDDGNNRSAPVTQMVEAKNAPPVALVADVPHAVELGSVITLDGSGSTDCDGDALAYRWYFDHVPEGSNAELSDPTVVNPTFVPDVAGLYAPRLVAFDGLDESEPHGVFIWAGTDQPPVAIAPLDFTMDVGETATLDGTDSYDPDPNDALATYAWRLIEQPSTSGATLGAADQRSAELTPDVAGAYVIELVVKDELGVESAPDQVVITAR